SELTQCQPRFTLIPYTTLFRSLFQSKGIQVDCKLITSTTLPGRGWLVSHSVHSTLIEKGIEVIYHTKCTEVGGDFIKLENGKMRSEEHTSELQSRFDLVCRLLL